MAKKGPKPKYETIEELRASKVRNAQKWYQENREYACQKQRERYWNKKKSQENNSED